MKEELEYMVEAQNGSSSFAEDENNNRQETLDYLQLAGISPQEEYPVDRSRSIFELIDERKYPANPVSCDTMALLQVCR